MTADITRTWAGVAAMQTDAAGLPTDPAERERVLILTAARTVQRMTPEARDRHIACMRRRLGDAATDAKLAEWREALREEASVP